MFHEILLKEQKVPKKTMREGISCHAEVAVLDKYFKLIKKKIRHKNLELVVIRVSKSGELVDSTPCSNCVNLIKLHGIKKVSFSNKEGIIVTKKVDEINYKPSSAGKILKNFC